MDSEDAFWLGLWKYAFSVICVLVLIVASNSAYRDHLIHDALLKTANPEGVACAFGGQSVQPLCLLRAAKGGE